MVRLIKLQAVYDLIDDIEVYLTDGLEPFDLINIDAVSKGLRYLRGSIDDEWHDEVETYFINKEEEEYDTE